MVIDSQLEAAIARAIRVLVIVATFLMRCASAPLDREETLGLNAENA